MFLINPLACLHACCLVKPHCALNGPINSVWVWYMVLLQVVTGNGTTVGWEFSHCEVCAQVDESECNWCALISALWSIGDLSAGWWEDRLFGRGSASTLVFGC